MQPKPHRLLLPLILINCAAVLAGIYYYYDQLAATPLQLLIFVPDCPLFVFLALLLILGIARSRAFSFFVSAGMVKYGMWTVFALLFHSGAYFAPSMFFISAIFVIGHLGMALEGLALLPSSRVGASALAFTILILLANDFSDYWLGTVPPIPKQGMGLVLALTVASSLALPLILWKYGKRIRELPPVRQLREIMGD